VKVTARTVFGQREKFRIWCRSGGGWFDIIAERVTWRQCQDQAPKIKRRQEMRFLSIYKTVERNTPPSPEEMAAMGKLVEEGMKSGWLVSTEGCLPSAMGARVRCSEGKMTVIDGPFTETREVVGGFAILNANSKEEAIEITKAFLGHMGQGECELRPLFEANCAEPVRADAVEAA
jgi:hypothetical protein